MADEIKSKLGLEVEINPGRTASFEITVEGNLIFSKLNSGRFPEATEILTKLK